MLRGRATPNHTPLSYLTIRDRFLEAYADRKIDPVEWSAQVASYVSFCWLEEREAHRSACEAASKAGAAEPAFDDLKYIHCWDRLNERQFIELREQGENDLNLYVAKRRLLGARQLLREFFIHIFRFRWLIWTLAEMGKGFIGGLGLIVIGLTIANFIPELGRAVRHAVDEGFPTSSEQTKTIQSGPKPANSLY